MADRYTTNIQIGGTISKSIKVPEEGLEPEDWSTQYEKLRDIISFEMQIMGDTTMDDHESGDVLEVEADEMANGEFTDLEPLCRELGLTYKRVSCDISFWEPGMENPRYYDNDDDDAGTPVIALEYVHETFNKGGTLADIIAAYPLPIEVPPLIIID